METKTDEIADGIFRFSTLVPDIGPRGFSFNQFLVTADEPLLFHTGPRQMFPLVSEAVGRVVPIEQLRWITFGHVESDECGAMNLLLSAAPNAEVAHGALGCMVSLKLRGGKTSWPGTAPGSRGPQRATRPRKTLTTTATARPKLIDENR